MPVRLKKKDWKEKLHAQRKLRESEPKSWRAKRLKRVSAKEWQRLQDLHLLSSKDLPRSARQRNPDLQKKKDSRKRLPLRRHALPKRSALKKREFVAELPFTLYRFHDFIHWGVDFDHINEGFLRLVGWKGTFDGRCGFTLETPTTVYELAKSVKEVLGIRHPRIIGNPDLLVTKIDMMLGAGGSGAADNFLGDDNQLMITGEICEWRDGEPIRDASQFGIPKAMLVLGHCACESPGMKVYAADMAEKYPALEVTYIESGELFSYVD